MLRSSNHRRNLRGFCFKGQDLTGEDFSNADIQGSDFTNAILTGANFSKSRGGLSLKSLVLISLLIILLTILSGFITGYATGVMVSLPFANFYDYQFSSPSKNFWIYALISTLISFLVLFIFFWISLQKGLAFAGITAITIAACVAMPAAFASVEIATLSLVQSLAISGAVAGVSYSAVTSVSSVIITKARLLPITTVIGITSATFGISFGIAGVDDQNVVVTCIISGIVTLILLRLGMLIGKRAWQDDPKYKLVLQLALAITARGTCFRGANLTDANFFNASLSNTSFKGACLIRTNWTQVEQLKRAYVNGTYLDQKPIQQLVVTKVGCHQSFERQDLRSLNLDNANLADINLIGADLGGSTLQGANLSRAKLVQTQLQCANLNQACLTGAYIQDWGISTSTHLEQIKCDYIYMRLPTTENPDPCRKPDNRNECFEPGDFSDFMAPIIKTLNLYHQQYVDPRIVADQFKSLDLYHRDGIDSAAAAIALKTLAEKYPNSILHVVALEGKGKDKVRLQAQVARNVDLSKLSAEYFQKYGDIQSLNSSDERALLNSIAEKDERILSLESMLAKAIESNRFYVETYYHLGDKVSEKNSPHLSSNSGDINYVGGDIHEVSGVLNLGHVNGVVTNVISQLQDSVEDEQQSLKIILTRLQQAILSESDLSQEDKAEALDQVKTLAEASQKPDSNPMKKAAKTAIKILNGTAASLPDTTKLVNEINQLLPAIKTLIGLL